jgi:VWFA-related protein
MLLAAAAAVTLSAQTAAQDQAQPTFRSVSDAVPVHVAVRRDRKLVAGLTTGDFELFDNGIRQTISRVTMETMPVDVSLVIDTSGSVVRSMDRFRSDARRMAGMLGSQDEVRLLTFDSKVAQTIPMQSASKRLPVDSIRAGDLTSFLDATLFALARAPRPDRRHLVFVFTDGFDNASVAGYGMLPLVASRTESVLHIVLVKVTGVPDEGSPAAREALATAAARTGGTLYPPSESSGDVVAAFAQTLDAFRHSYVLYYIPTGVPREGWHDIAVHVTRAGTYDVAARQRYFGG